MIETFMPKFGGGGGGDLGHAGALESCPPELRLIILEAVIYIFDKLPAESSADDNSLKSAVGSLSALNNQQ